MPQNNVAPVFTNDDLLRLLPHRWPMLMVDRILSCTTDYCVAEKLVSQTEPALPGHFPGNPVFPGVLMLEALGQAGSMILRTRQPNKNPIFAGVESLRFHRMVVPGDRIVLHAEVVAHDEKRGLYTLQARAEVAGESACEGLLIIAMR